MSPPRLVLLDLDGTLADTARDLWAAAAEMLATLGHPPVDECHVRGYVGDGVPRLVHRCLTRDMQADAPAHAFAPALETFLDCYARHNGSHARVYDGVPEGLALLAGAGIKAACVTNKPRDYALALLERLGLARCLDPVVCADEVARPKPAPDALLQACRTAGVPAAECVMIGDSRNDVRAAREAGMRVLCVSYGYNHGRDIRESCPDGVAGRLDELVRTLL